MAGYASRQSQQIILVVMGWTFVISVGSSAVFSLLLLNHLITLQTPLLVRLLSDLLNLRLRCSRFIESCRPVLSAFLPPPRICTGTYHSPVFLHVFTSLPLITPTISPINFDFDPSGSAAYSLTKANSPVY